MLVMHVIRAPRTQSYSRPINSRPCQLNPTSYGCSFITLERQGAVVVQRELLRRAILVRAHPLAA